MSAQEEFSMDFGVAFLERRFLWVIKPSSVPCAGHLSKWVVFLKQIYPELIFEGIYSRADTAHKCH
jgi:hypothetical protein